MKLGSVSHVVIERTTNAHSFSLCKKLCWVMHKTLLLPWLLLLLSDESTLFLRYISNLEFYVWHQRVCRHTILCRRCDVESVTMIRFNMRNIFSFILITNFTRHWAGTASERKSFAIWRKNKLFARWRCCTSSLDFFKKLFRRNLSSAEISRKK